MVQTHYSTSTLWLQRTGSFITNRDCRISHKYFPNWSRWSSRNPEVSYGGMSGFWGTRINLMGLAIQGYKTQWHKYKGKNIQDCKALMYPNVLSQVRIGIICPFNPPFGWVNFIDFQFRASMILLYPNFTFRCKLGGFHSVHILTWGWVPPTKNLANHRLGSYPRKHVILQLSSDALVCENRN
jgi:hypothetical protein